VYFFYGETGLGKTHAIRFLEPDFCDRVYVKVHGTRFWDGYEGQEVVLFDDLRPEEYQCQDMLRYLQKFAMSVEVKGSTRPACWTKVYITTNVPIEAWYMGVDRATREAFLGRIPEKNRVSFHVKLTTATDDAPFTTVRQLKALQAKYYAEMLAAEEE
jgi:hypothetical protein